MINNLSLRLRLTFLTGLIIVCTSLGLTLTSIYNANNSFTSLSSKITSVPSSDNNMEKEKLDKDIDSLNQSTENYNLKISVASQESKKFNILSFVYLFIFMLLGMLGAYIISGKALKPVTNLSKSVKDIGEHNLSERILTPKTNDEIEDLTKSFNDMLERLEDAFEKQKRFSANVAHELKTPLSIIKAGIQVLNLDENPKIEDYKENTAVIEQSTNRLIKIVNDLLSLTHENDITSNDKILLKQMFQLLINDLKLLYKNKNINFSLNVDTEYIKGNKTLIYRAFFNLIENAIKYNKNNGSIFIDVKFENSNTNILIKDTGIGIPSKDLEMIFEPFYCVDKSRSKQTGGSGLGLSLVKTIIEKFNGTISVKSQLDIGTTFIVNFKE